MATIYRFIVESQTTQASSSRKERPQMPKKTTAKKGKWVSLFQGEKGGVEHNRKMRAINPMINKMTGGVWEQGLRIGRAGMGLFKFNTATGATALSGVAVVILLQFIIKMLLKWQNYEAQKSDRQNAQNFKAMENGIGGVHGAYKITRNYFNGRITYNENK